MTDLRQVYHQHFQGVYRFLLSLSRDEHVAEELTQETFFKALKHIDSFQGTCKLSVWLCQIAKHTYFSYLEKQKRYEPASQVEHSSGLDIEWQTVDKAEAFRIHQILHLMDEPYKEVFTLRVFGELSFGEISQLFEKNESWARVTFFRAKQKIQSLYKEENRP